MFHHGGAARSCGGGGHRSVGFWRPDPRRPRLTGRHRAVVRRALGWGAETCSFPAVLGVLEVVQRRGGTTPGVLAACRRVRAAAVRGDASHAPVVLLVCRAEPASRLPAPPAQPSPRRTARHRGRGASPPGPPGRPDTHTAPHATDAPIRRQRPASSPMRYAMPLRPLAGSTARPVWTLVRRAHLTAVVERPLTRSRRAATAASRQRSAETRKIAK
jgi:hypothetical protein